MIQSVREPIVNGLRSTTGERMPIREQWLNLPEKLRFVLVGIGGLCLGWLIYNGIYFLNPLEENRASTSWAIGYFLAIIRQHALHYFFTFSKSDSSYLKSLIGAFGAYGIGWIITTVVNNIFTSIMEINHQLSFFLTAGVGVIFNYILLKKIAFTESKQLMEVEM